MYSPMYMSWFINANFYNYLYLSLSILLLHFCQFPVSWKQTVQTKATFWTTIQRVIYKFHLM